MKKTFLIIFSLILFCGINNLSYAYLEEPIFEPFEAVVSNEEGAEYFEITYDEIESIGKKKYQEKVSIVEEYEVENELYGKLDSEENYYVKISDLKATDEEYKKINQEKSQDIIVVANEIQVRKGPSEKYYSVVSKIPKGTKLTGYFAKDSENLIHWLYVEYNGTNGWINCDIGEVGYQYSLTSNLLNIEKVSIFKENNEQDKIGEIPAYEIINYQNLIAVNFKYIFMSDLVKKGFNYDENTFVENNYITYNGIEGYVTIKQYGEECNDTYEVKEEMALYESPSGDSRVLIKEIPLGTSLQYNYYSTMGRSDGTSWNHGFWAYTKYNEKNGWIQVVDDNYQIQKTEVLDTINELEKKTEENNTSNNRINKIIIICVLTIVLIGSIILLIYILKNKNK